MTEQPPPDAQPPYGNPPPPPATNPYATPGPPAPAAPTPAPAYGTPPPPPGYAAPTYPSSGYPGSTPAPGPGGLAVTGLVFAIAAGVLFWVPFLGIVLALVGLTLGIVAWARAGSTSRSKGMPIAATIVAALALLGAIMVTLFVLFFWHIVVDCADPNLTSDQQSTCIQNGVNDRFGIGST